MGDKYIRHSDVAKATAAIMVAQPEMSYEEVAEFYNVSIQTIRNWEKGYLAKKAGLPQLIELTIQKMLESMPTEWTGATWGITFGILVDKLLLLQGRPNEIREETVTNILERTIPSDQREEVMREFRNIVDAQSEPINTEGTSSSDVPRVKAGSGAE